MVEIGKNEIITSINPETGEPIIGKNEQDTSGNMTAEDLGSVAVGNIIPAPRNIIPVEKNPNRVFNIPEPSWETNKNALNTPYSEVRPGVWDFAEDENN